MGGLVGFFCVWLCWLGGHGGWVIGFGGVLCTAWLFKDLTVLRVRSPWSAATNNPSTCTGIGTRTRWVGWFKKQWSNSCIWETGSASATTYSSRSGGAANAGGNGNQPSASGLKDGSYFGPQVSWLCFGSFYGLIRTLAGPLSWQPASGSGQPWKKWTSQDGVREGLLPSGMSAGWFWSACARLTSFARRTKEDLQRTMRGAFRLGGGSGPWPAQSPLQALASCLFWVLVLGTLCVVYGGVVYLRGVLFLQAMHPLNGSHQLHRLECPSHRFCIGHIMCNLALRSGCAASLSDP